jgi:predicted nucleic-acid-binding Zn-ribbon protein
MDFEQQLIENFCCAKCRGKSAVTRCVPLSGGLPDLLGLSAGKYILLTCGLCGYTEIYSRCVMAPSEEKAKATARAVKET